MTRLELFTHEQKDGKVVLEVSYEPHGSAEVVIDRDNVLPFLSTVLNAIRVGPYSDEERSAAAASCAAMLAPVRR